MVHRSPPVIWQYLSGHREMGEKFARHIEKCLRLPAGWMDHPSDAVPDRPAPVQQPAVDVPAASALTPRQQALLGYFDGLTEAQQEAVLRELSEKKQVNQAIVAHFLARQKAS
jgi:hypothetical protein